MDADAGAEEVGTAVDDALLEEDVEDLYENAPVGYVSSLPGGEIVKANGTLLEWTGYSRDELVGRKRLHDLLAPGARIYYETHYAPLLQMQGSVHEIAVELVRADGRRLPALLNSSLVRDEAGTPRIVRTTVFNATERRRYERELLRARADAELRARAALALAHANDGVLLVADGRVDVLNHAAETILGLDADTGLGRQLAELVPGWAELESRIPVGEPGAPVEPATLPLRRGEHEQWLSIAGVEAHDAVVYTFRDVTSERALDEIRSDLVAVVSHELRTPLSGVYGSAQTLLAHHDALDEPSRRQLLQMIVEQGERLTRILDEILLTSSLDTGGFAVEISTFDAGEVAARVRERLPEPQRARVSVDGAPGRAAGDAGTTAQVLANLVDNALKYSDGDVRVRVTLEGGSIRFTVADDGPGIPPDEHDRIFAKFHRLDPAQRMGVGGTGLGLYIARELTRRMHGRIGLLPTERGTTFFVDLPAAL